MFRIELPTGSLRATAPAEEPRQAEMSQREHPLTAPRLDGVRILVVDDDRDALALFQEALESTGATVMTARSARQAIDLLERTTPDVLLADLGMPHMSGFDLIAQVRRSARPDIRDIPAAALTAHARAEDRTKALRSGFQVHLTKPVDPGELMAAMATLAKHPSAAE